MFNDDLTIISFETITGLTLAGDPWFILDELQKVTISNTEESQKITGKNGRSIGTLKKYKGVTITGISGLVSAGLMETQTGGRFKKTKSLVKWIDYLTIDNNQAVTTWVAVGTTGREIDGICVKNKDDTIAAQLTQSDTVSSSTFTYNPETKVIVFNEGDYEDGTEIVAYYSRRIVANVLANRSDASSGKCQLYIDALAKNKCDDVFRVQFYIPKADFKGNFDLVLGDSQTTHEFEADSLPASCVGSGNLWTYTVFQTHLKIRVKGEGAELYIDTAYGVETTCVRYWTLGDMDPYDLGELDSIAFDDMKEIY